MKIKLNRLNKEKVAELFAYKEFSMTTNELLADYLRFNSRLIKKEMMADFKKANNGFIYYLRAYFGDDYLDQLRLLEIDENYLKKMVHLLSPSKYLNNPYYRNIRIKKIKSKNWEFKYSTYHPYEGFVYNDLEIDSKHYLEIPQIGFFEDKFTYLEVYQNGKEWMSITPNEIETMEEAIKGMYGDVVTYGLGLGYFAYMASLKEEVRSVTIVEIDKEVINLFKKNILPLFKNKEKIKIVNMDAYKHAQEDNHYDCAFVDLWHDASDGLWSYLDFCKLEKEGCDYYYWIERSILTMLRRSILVVLEDEMNGVYSDAYGNDKIDSLFKALAQYLRDYEINTYKDVYTLLSEEKLRLISRSI